MTDQQILKAAEKKIGNISPDKLEREYIQVPVEWMSGLTACWSVVTFKKTVDDDGRTVWRDDSTFDSWR